MTFMEVDNRLVSRWIVPYHLNPNVNMPLFPTNANPQQLYHSPRVEILAFNELTHASTTDNASFSID